MSKKKRAKRRMERFSVGLRSAISVRADGETRRIRLRTDNICEGGAYFRTASPLSPGTEVGLEIMTDHPSRPEGRKVRVRMSGSVIRRDSEGMAVAFDRSYQISPVCEPGTVTTRIIGPSRLQNELLMRFLEEHTGMRCLRNGEPFPPCDPGDASAHHIHLTLWDGLCGDMFFLYDLIRKNAEISQCLPALFNISPDSVCGEACLERGIRGIFHTTDSPDVLLEGIGAVLDRKLWYPDTVLSAYFSRSEEEARLTLREREILSRVASGELNKEIADVLCISINTVKRHISNLYRKIGVGGRLQAVLWAVRHLSDLNQDMQNQGTAGAQPVCWISTENYMDLQ